LRHVSERREIGRRVFGSDAAFVVTEQHIHHPMQAVFDGPVFPDHRADQVRQQDQRCDVEARFALCFSVDEALAVDDDDALPGLCGASMRM
jgi:hypothetical protein